VKLLARLLFQSFVLQHRHVDDRNHKDAASNWDAPMCFIKANIKTYTGNDTSSKAYVISGAKAEALHQLFHRSVPFISSKLTEWRLAHELA